MSIIHNLAKIKEAIENSRAKETSCDIDLAISVSVSGTGSTLKSIHPKLNKGIVRIMRLKYEDEYVMPWIRIGIRNQPYYQNIVEGH